MANQTQNFENMFRDAMDALPMNSESFEDGFKRTAEFNERLTGIAVDAAGRGTELTSDYTKKTLGRVGELTRAKDQPADYAQSFADFGRGQTEATVEVMNSFAEVFKATQAATIEAMTNFGKSAQDKAASSAKKSASNAKSAAQNANNAAS